MSIGKIAIIGGGITGLYCAYILKKNNYDVYLFEETERVGGRIRTLRLDGNGRRIEAEQFEQDPMPKQLAFHAEFGPMRVAPFEHRLLQKLLKELGFGDPQDETVTGISPTSRRLRLEDFPPYSSPIDSKAPRYDLRPDEVGKTPLSLLQLAIRRIMLRVSLRNYDREPPAPNPSDDINQARKAFNRWKRELSHNLKLAEDVGDDPTSYFLESVRQLQKEPRVIWAIQTHGAVEMYFGQEGSNHPIERIPLYTLGFWNLLSGFLSHDAVEEVRNIGTFYHLMPDNPNAAEWLAWWLSGLAISDRLKGFEAGTEILIEELKRKLKATSDSGEQEGVCQIFCGKRALAIHRSEQSTEQDSRPLILLRNQEARGKEGYFGGDEDGKIILLSESKKKNAIPFDNVILALPKDPLQKLILRSAGRFQRPQDQLEELMDSSYGFPLVKVFFMVRRRWWVENTQPNESASRVPTREIHRFETKLKLENLEPKLENLEPKLENLELKEIRRGMVMLYTDRPASAFWGNFVQSGRHTDVLEWRREKNGSEQHDVLNQWSRLRKKIVRYFRQFAGESFREDDILWMGIRDWSRDPYAGGNHAWRPKRRYWHVMKELAGLKLKADKGSDTKQARVHICGEAYSDYHGFMEGALRSAILVLSKILGNPTPRTADTTTDADKTTLDWLDGKAKLSPEEGAREYLDDWILALNSDQGGLYHWDRVKDEKLKLNR